MFVDRVNLDDRPATAFEDGLDLAADCAGRVLLCAENGTDQTNECGEGCDEPAKDLMSSERR